MRRGVIFGVLALVMILAVVAESSKAVDFPQRPTESEEMFIPGALTPSTDSGLLSAQMIQRINTATKEIASMNKRVAAGEITKEEALRNNIPRIESALAITESQVNKIIKDADSLYANMCTTDYEGCGNLQRTYTAQWNTQRSSLTAALSQIASIRTQLNAFKIQSGTEVQESPPEASGSAPPSGFQSLSSNIASKFPGGSAAKREPLFDFENFFRKTIGGISTQISLKEKGQMIKLWEFAKFPLFDTEKKKEYGKITDDAVNKRAEEKKMTPVEARKQLESEADAKAAANVAAITAAKADQLVRPLFGTSGNVGAERSIAGYPNLAALSATGDSYELVMGDNGNTYIKDTKTGAQNLWEGFGVHQGETDVLPSVNPGDLSKKQISQAQKNPPAEDPTPQEEQNCEAGMYSTKDFIDNCITSDGKYAGNPKEGGYTAKIVGGNGLETSSKTVIDPNTGKEKIETTIQAKEGVQSGQQNTEMVVSQDGKEFARIPMAADVQPSQDELLAMQESAAPEQTAGGIGQVLVTTAILSALGFLGKLGITKVMKGRAGKTAHPVGQYPTVEDQQRQQQVAQPAQAQYTPEQIQQMQSPQDNQQNPGYPGQQ